LSLKDIEDGFVIAAAIIGGLWALLRVWTERTYEAAIDIEISSTCAADGPEYLVFLDVVLTNKGHTRVQAKYKRSEGWAYNDGVEKLKHSGSLQVRRILPWVGPNNRFLDWFETPLLDSIPHLPEVNLLTEYEDPEQNNKIDFWMEPNETYHLGAPIVLSAGLYLAKVTFIGAAGDDNFWSRIHFIQVPVRPLVTPPERSD
jgi:hypothetical protein